jgi:hypothetical protein
MEKPRSRRVQGPSGTTGRGRIRHGLSAVAFTLLVMAVVKELRTPRAARTWHGTVAGFVPYDLRPPTLARVRASLWAPQDARLLLPRSFGVGWSPNIARAVALLRRDR